MRPFAVVAVLATIVVAGVLVLGPLPIGRPAATRDTTSDAGTAYTAVETTTGAVELTVRAPSDDDFRQPPVLDDLPDPAVVRLRVVGFEAYGRGQARQCRTMADGTECDNQLPVQFGADGTADFQYLVTEIFADDAGSPSCGATDPPCLIVVTSLDRRQWVEVQTVFGASLPPPARTTVTPTGPLTDGQVVDVRVEGLPPATTAIVTTCVAPSASGERRCGAPAPTRRLTVGADGNGEVSLVVTRGPVGRDGVLCDREHRCAIAVIADRSNLRAEPALITLAALPGARYDPVRLTAGLAVAMLLLGLAAGLIRRTDWSAVGEAAAPEIDEAEYADLDAIVAALPPEDEDALSDQ